MTYLAPDSTPIPPYDGSLDDIFHDLIQGVTGIDPTLIRPRWQPSPPNQPDFDANWVAFGITSQEVDTFAWVGHNPAGNSGLGTNELERDERVTVLHSFYGPSGSALMARYRDGLQIDQNREALATFGVKLVEVQPSPNVPALLKEKWVRRIDLPVVFIRRVKRSYSVPSLVGLSSADPTNSLDNEQYVTKIPTNTH